MTLNNLSPSHHPFHLHGHRFQLVSRGSQEKGGFPRVPMRGDSISVDGLSSAVIRFKADNPGVWLIHCHIEWHMPLGMAATFIEEPRALQKSLKKVPRKQLEICEAQGTSSEGDARGNTRGSTNVQAAASVSHIPSSGFVALVCLLVSWSWLTS